MVSLRHRGLSSANECCDTVHNIFLALLELVRPHSECVTRRRRQSEPDLRPEFDHQRLAFGTDIDEPVARCPRRCVNLDRRLGEASSHKVDQTINVLLGSHGSVIENPATISARLIENNLLGVDDLDPKGSVLSQVRVVSPRSKAFDVGPAFHIAHAVVQRWVHPPVCEPRAGIERNTRKLILDAVESVRKLLPAFT